MHSATKRKETTLFCLGWAKKLLTDLNLKSALEGDSPHGIDEWQEVPATIRDAVVLKQLQNRKRARCKIENEYIAK